MSKYLLDFDGDLVLHLPTGEGETFRYGAFYKLSVRRYEKSFYGDTLIFKSELGYIEYKKIISLFRRDAEKKGYELEVSSALSDYIECRELYVEERSRLGIEIKNREDKLSERFDTYRRVVDGGMSRKLRERQMWDSFFMCAMQKSANFSVPGSGKTASVLGMYAYLRAKELVSRIVVICPKNAFGSWMDEFSVCFDGIEPLKVLNIHSSDYKNTAARKNAIMFESGRCNLILVNYESVGSLCDALCSVVKSNTLLVFDEVHKVKRVGGEHAEHALKIAADSRFTVALTGTPIPNTYLDVYNLLHIMFPNEYDTFFDFPLPMLRNPRGADVEEINNKLQPFFCRTTKDQLGVPPANPDSILSVKASETENELLHILKMKYRKNRLALFIRILQLESNPKMLLQSLSLADFKYLLDDGADVYEIDYADYSREVERLINGCGTPTKFLACVDLAKKLKNDGKPLIIWCIFKDSINRLAETLEENGIPTRCVYGEVPLEERQSILADFKSGKFKVLLTNPHTLAESVSLHSVCHDAIYFEYSYNLVHLLQSKDRIHRLGLPEGQYTQYEFLQLAYNTDDGEWSMDSAVYDSLKAKEKTMLDAIDRKVLETLPTSEEDLEMIFKDLI
ncbi:MAG: DEAD/DEAH box helicase family protein [Clostridia bacterium]|nr:DEAD/DEAH box helicase family protein [Clostridia bacterium]